MDSACRLMSKDMSVVLEEAYTTVDKNTKEFNQMLEDNSKSFKNNMKLFYSFTGFKNFIFWFSIAVSIATFVVLLISVIKGFRVSI